MELKFYRPKEPATRAKLTVQRSGKMGFSKGAADLLDIEKYRFAKIGTNTEGELFILLQSEADDATFNIAKAGQYYYISAKGLLDEMGIDYKSPDTTIFDIQKTKTTNIYKLSKRVIKK